MNAQLWPESIQSRHTLSSRVSEESDCSTAATAPSDRIAPEDRDSGTRRVSGHLQLCVPGFVRVVSVTPTISATEIVYTPACPTSNASFHSR